MKIKWVVLITIVSLTSQGEELNAVQYLHCLINKQKTALRSQLVDSEADLDLAEHAFYPSVSADFETGKDVLDNTTNVTGDASLTLTQRLLDLSKSKTKEQKRSELKSNRYYLLSQIYDTVKNLTSTYFDQFQQAGQQKILSNQAAQLEKTITLLKEITRVKMADASDLLAAKTNLLKISMQMKDVELASKNNLTQIRSQAGLANTVQFSEEVSSSLPTTKEYWTEKLENFSALSYLKFKAISYTEEKESLQKEILPALSWRVTLAKPVYGYAATASNTSAAILASLTVPLYDGSTRSINMGRASAQKIVVDEALRLNRNSLQATVTQTLDTLAQLEQQKKSSEERVALAEKALSAAWTKFKLGKMSFINFNDYQSALSEAQLADLQVDTDKSKTMFQLYLLELFSSDYTGFWKQVSATSCK